VTPNVGRDGAEVEVALTPFRAVEELHAHRFELLIDVRVVDDLADQEGALAGKFGPRLVRVLHRPVDAIAEAELAGQTERQITDGERIPRGAHGIHHAAVVVGHQGAFDRALQAEALSEVGLFHDPSI
jgi:hypothetical protein